MARKLKVLDFHNGMGKPVINLIRYTVKISDELYVLESGVKMFIIDRVIHNNNIRVNYIDNGYSEVSYISLDDLKSDRLYNFLYKLQMI